jgi:competence protein ComEA
MKIKLSSKAKLASLVAAFAAVVGVGVWLDKTKEDRFVIETIPIEDNSLQEDTTNNAQPVSDATEKEVINNKVNINAADVEVIAQLDGIGEKMAQRIIDYREENGDFNAIEEITLVNGIGQKKFEDIKDSICVE